MISRTGEKPERGSVLWGAADQFMSGLSNILLVLTVAKVGSPSELGALTASIVVVTSLLAVSRASLGTHIMLCAGQSSRRMREETNRVMSLVLLVALPLMALVVAIGAFSGRGEAIRAVILVGIGAPLVILQDLLRFVCSARLLSRWALYSDSVWAASTGLGFVLLSGRSTENDSAIFDASLFWLAGTVLALSLLSLRLRWGLSFQGLWRWVCHNSNHLKHSAAGTTAISLANVARVSVIGAIVGPLAVGALAAGQLLMTPLNLAVALIPFVAMPLISRRARSSREVKNAYIRLGLLVTGSSLAWWGLCLLIPSSIGRALLGESWTWADQLLAPMAIMTTGILLAASASSLLLAMNKAKFYSMSSTCVAVASMVSAAVVSLLSGSIEVLAWAQTGVVWFGVVVSWLFAIFSSPENSDA